MTETKIPMQIFTSYEALTQYYGDRDDCELGLYVSDNELLVGHVPTAYSFNPQYFTGNNELLPDYAPPSVIDYTVSAESNNSTYGYVTGAGTYPQHSEITLNAYAYNGYKFDKWSNDVETAAYTFAVEENVDLTAIFVDNTYTVTLDINIQDSGTVTGAGTYVAGTSVTVTATPNEGFRFFGWTQGSPYIISTEPEYTFILEEDTALTAEFNRLYTVTATPNNVSYGSTSGSGTYNEGSSATVTATAESGYRFVNWTEDNVEVSTSSSYTFWVNKNTTLVANFEPATANISISASPAGYGSVDAAGSTVIGESYTVMATPSSDNVFTNWTENGTIVSTSSNYTFTVTGDRTLVANFTTNPKYEPFYVENITDTNETLSITKAGSSAASAPTIYIDYSSDGQTWTSLGSTSTTALTRTITPGEKLYLRASATTWGDGNTKTHRIGGVSRIGGNIMSLLYGSNFTGNETTFPSGATNCFAYLFKGQTSIISIEKLILPATTLVEGCYAHLFYQTHATGAAPELPAAIIPQTACSWMFYKTTINYVKCLATDTSAYYATGKWLAADTSGGTPVSATGTFVKKAGSTWSSDTSGIPSGWTVVEV